MCTRWSSRTCCAADGSSSPTFDPVADAASACSLSRRPPGELLAPTRCRSALGALPRSSWPLPPDSNRTTVVTDPWPVHRSRIVLPARRRALTPWTEPCEPRASSPTLGWPSRGSFGSASSTRPGALSRERCSPSEPLDELLCSLGGLTRSRMRSRRRCTVWGVMPAAMFGGNVDVRIVLDAADEAAYGRIRDRLVRMWHHFDPLSRWMH
jgi:hypothetical protein